jgi:aspartate aminotransferase
MSNRASPPGKFYPYFSFFHKGVTMQLARRIRQIPPSATLALNAKANQLKAQGVDIVNFGVGEPDFDTPDNIREAAIRAIREALRATPRWAAPRS